MDKERVIAKNEAEIKANELAKLSKVNQEL